VLLEDEEQLTRSERENLYNNLADSLMFLLLRYGKNNPQTVELVQKGRYTAACKINPDGKS
jgi:hypothetical protein